MSRFYTNVSVRGDNILYRGYENGKRVEGRIDYHPTLFISTNKSSEFHTMDGRSAEPFQPGTMSDCRDFILRHESVTGFDIYGNTDYIYQFIGDKFPKEVEYDQSVLKVAYIDIETTAENGFPQVANPNERVITITLIVQDREYVFALGDCAMKEGINLYTFTNEQDLLLKFLEIWEGEDPDIVTGWNVKFFDMPYLYARMDRVIEKRARKISPWGTVKQKNIQTQSGDRIAFEFVGLTILD